MDFTAPVSKFMTKKLITVAPHDSMSMVKDLFDQNKVHHILVVRHKKLLGIISRVDCMQFLKCANSFGGQTLEEKSKLQTTQVEEIMTQGIATLEPNDRINVALQIFMENFFHAIPVVEDDEVVGILTTYDIIKALQEEDILRIKAN